MSGTRKLDGLRRAGESVGADFARRAGRGAAITFAILSGLLALAWLPFLRLGLSLVAAGRTSAGYGLVAVSGLLYLALWLRALRAQRQFVDDAQARRIHVVTFRPRPLRDERGKVVFPETAGGMAGYERPHADNHLWWMLLLAFAAGGVAHLQPWQSEVLRGLLRDPVGAFTHGIPARPRAERGASEAGGEAPVGRARLDAVAVPALSRGGR